MPIEMTFRLTNVGLTEMYVSRKRDGSTYRLTVYRKGIRPGELPFTACEVDIILLPEEASKLVSNLTELQAYPIGHNDGELGPYLDEIREAARKSE